MVQQGFDKKKTMKFKFKSAGINKVKDLGEELKTRKKVIEDIVANLPQPEIKDKKIKTPTKKVVYISKRGSKAIFDSIGLCAKIFDKDASTIKYRIEHPNVKSCLDFDWLKGGRLEYLNN